MAEDQDNTNILGRHVSRRDSAKGTLAIEGESSLGANEIIELKKELSGKIGREI